MCRSVEEVAGLKRKLEKYKSREWMAAGDEVLLEEIKTYRVGGHYIECTPIILSHSAVNYMTRSTLL